MPKPWNREFRHASSIRQIELNMWTKTEKCGLHQTATKYMMGGIHSRELWFIR